MPEFNRVFNEGKMNRDLDERLVPQGQYREGVNIEVTSSKNGNVGSVKNRKGNSPLVLNGLTLPGNELYGLSPEAECIDYVIAEETQKTYYFVKNAKFDDGTEKYEIRYRSLPDVNHLSYSAHVRIGMRNWALFGSYNFSPLFESNESIELYPIQMGLSISLF